MLKPPFHKSLFNAFRGLIVMLKTERNFQLECAAFCINIFLIFYLKLLLADAVLILILCFSVLTAETFNTAVEKLCDVVQPEYDLRIKFIKDISAAAVLMLTIASIICGGLIYFKYIF